MRAPLVLLALAGLVAGCGGGSDRDASGRTDQGQPELEGRLLETGEWKTDFRKHTVPFSEFVSGGPPKDGIPALDRPRFVSVENADFLEPLEPVIEVVSNGDARAYPLQILTWHEIVNDRVGGTPIAVTFCPLCNTAIAFDRRLRGRTLDFGTTGKLRNSDLVMYDRQTESWWQQFGGEGVVGHYAGATLRKLPARIVAWREFERAHREGKVLSRDTGYDRPYGQNPYEGYDDVDSPPIFPVVNADDDRLAPKERVVFIERDGESVAVPFSALARRPVLRIGIGKHRLVIRYRRGVASALDTPSIRSGRNVGAAQVLEDGKPVPFSEPFWFAVAALRPAVRIR